LPYPDETLSIEGKAADAAATGLALSKKAPSGYGLGGNAQYVEVNSLDELTANGWYAVRLLIPIVIDGFSVEHCYCEVSNYNVVIGTQKITPLGSGLVIRRFFDTTGFLPWEWENPYLAPDVEYRTTERWNGKPVYTKLMEFTNLITGQDTRYIGVHGVSTGGYPGLIRHYAFTATGRAAQSWGTTVDAWAFALHVADGNAHINTGSGIAESNDIIYLQAWYIRN
jgi:hypothetical protein